MHVYPPLSHLLIYIQNFFFGTLMGACTSCACLLSACLRNKPSNQRLGCTLGLSHSWQMVSQLVCQPGSTSLLNHHVQVLSWLLLRQNRSAGNNTLHCSLHLLWLHNGCCLQLKCICSWYILATQPHHLQFAATVLHRLPQQVCDSDHAGG